MMLPDPQSSPELFDGILIRRPLAYLIDLVMLSLITFAVMVVGVIGGFFSFGLLWVALPIALPLAIVLYYAATLGSPARATLGMRAIDLILTPARGRPLNGWRILIHPLLFWVTVWIAWPVIVVVVLFTPHRQTLHDLVTGTLLVRRSPMESHWGRVARGAL